MKIFKLIWSFFKYLFTKDNPLPLAYLLIPFLVLAMLSMSLMIYRQTDEGERVEFLSYSPLPSPAGKLYSLAYYSAINGDLELGRYFYELSLEYISPLELAKDDLQKMIYPEKNLQRKSHEVSEWLKIYPSSRDLYILQAEQAIEMDDNDLWERSITALKLIDPNNEVVLGLIDKVDP